MIDTTMKRPSKFMRALSNLRQTGRTSREPSPAATRATSSSTNPVRHDSVIAPTKAASEPDSSNHSPDPKNRDEGARHKETSSARSEPIASPLLDTSEKPPGSEATDHVNVDTGQNSTSAPLDVPPPESTTTQESFLTPTPAWTPEKHAEWLWGVAYDSLEDEKPNLIYQYERYVFAYITTARSDWLNVTLDPPSDLILPRTNTVGFGLPPRSVLMNDFLKAFRREPGQDRYGDTGKVRDLDPALDDKSSDVHEPGVDEPRAFVTKLLVAMRRYQYASIPWVASCLALEVGITDPPHLSESFSP